MQDMKKEKPSLRTREYVQPAMVRALIRMAMSSCTQPHQNALAAEVLEHIQIILRYIKLSLVLEKLRLRLYFCRIEPIVVLSHSFSSYSERV